VLPVAIYFLKDGNRSYYEGWNHINVVDRHDEPHATGNPSTSIPGIDIPGSYKIKICLQTICHIGNWYRQN
jgi:hypothetical protein